MINRRGFLKSGIGLAGLVLSSGFFPAVAHSADKGNWHNVRVIEKEGPEVGDIAFNFNTGEVYVVQRNDANGGPQGVYAIRNGKRVLRFAGADDPRATGHNTRVATHNGEVFVYSQDSRNGSISVYDSNGKLKSKLNNPFAEIDTLEQVHSINVNPADKNLYLSRYNQEKRILCFDRTENYVRPSNLETHDNFCFGKDGMFFGGDELTVLKSDLPRCSSVYLFKQHYKARKPVKIELQDPRQIVGKPQFELSAICFDEGGDLIFGGRTLRVAEPPARFEEVDYIFGLHLNNDEYAIPYLIASLVDRRNRLTSLCPGPDNSILFSYNGHKHPSGRSIDVFGCIGIITRGKSNPLDRQA